MARHRPSQRRVKTGSTRAAKGRQASRSTRTSGGTRTFDGSHASGGAQTPGGTHASGVGEPGNDTLSHAKELITRRGFLYGAVGVGTVALVAGGIGFATTVLDLGDTEGSYETLEVPSSAVSSSDGKDFTELPEASEHMQLRNSYALPFGTLLWTNNSTLAACLIPTENTSVPLTQVGILDLETGTLPIVLERAVGNDDGFDIFDVRAGEQGLIWAEANIMRGIWRVYTATMRNGAVGEPVLVEEGTEEWEMPTLALCGNRAFWQILPSLSGSKTTENSVLKSVRVGEAEGEIVYSSLGRMSTPPYALGDSLVITPRVNTDGVYHRLTLLDAESSEVRDELVLPSSMKPLEAGYGTTGFNFSFDGIYDYGGGISNLGTYTPTAAAEERGAGDYAGLSWFRFARTPSAPPAWCGKYFVVKSTRAICGTDFSTNSYWTLEAESGSDDYGDYLASTGVNDVIVTYANIDARTLEGEERHLCSVRVWAPIASSAAAAS